VDWIQLAQDGENVTSSCIHGNKHPNFLTSWGTVSVPEMMNVLSAVAVIAALRSVCTTRRGGCCLPACWLTVILVKSSYHCSENFSRRSAARATQRRGKAEGDFEITVIWLSRADHRHRIGNTPTPTPHGPPSRLSDELTRSVGCSGCFWRKHITWPYQRNETTLTRVAYKSL
jgi:hypothetical protein